MFVSYFTLFSGLLLSIISEYFSITGLMVIFPGAALSVAVMGIALGFAKISATIWLKTYWKEASVGVKSYLISAISILVFITSLGCFGLLSKAHSEQSLVQNEVTSRLEFIDINIKLQQENLDAAKKSLQQLDQSVDQVLSRSTTEDGAARSAQLRRTQQRERAALQRDIGNTQNNIAALNKERLEISGELRAVESKVGPIKYIAAFIYGQQPDAAMLEKAVSWMIILLVVVFDPLAIMLLLASQTSFLIRKQSKLPTDITPIKQELESTIVSKDTPVVNKVEQVSTPIAEHTVDINESSKPSPIEPGITPTVKRDLRTKTVKVFPRTTNNEIPKPEIKIIDNVIPQEKHKEMIIKQWVEDVKSGKVEMKDVPENILLEVRGRI